MARSALFTIPRQATFTRQFPVYFSSKKNPPVMVGIPTLFP